jgi:hypothetical protein
MPSLISRTLSSVLLIALAPAAVAAPAAAELAAMAARFAPVDIVVPLTGLPASEQAALGKMIGAARILNGIYLGQIAPGNAARLVRLAADPTPLGRARLEYFEINKGAWSMLDRDAPFLPGVGPRPEQGGFYPADATRAEVEAWFATLAGPARSAAEGFFTTIRRDPSGRLMAVPYSLEYQSELLDAARLLREAAALTTQPRLRTFLEARAAAFLSNDYHASDVAWMDLDATIEPTIGPYETYEDAWFNFKAAFEGVVGVVDAAETQKLTRFSAELQDLEDHLPVDPRFRRPKLGAASPIRLINVVYASADADRAVKLAAYNLPNDEAVVAEKGSKRVLLKNFQQAKFDHVLVPIAAVALGAADRKRVAFEPFFTHILMHELMHGLGPQTITVAGRATSVRAELKEVNGPLEEAKADISGLWALERLMDRGVLPKSEEQAVHVTYLASMFRTLRFGTADAHAKGMALQLNYLMEAGAVTVGSDGRFAINAARIRPAVEGLTREILTIQATGDYARARDWLGRMQVLKEPVRQVFERLGTVPTDIRPHFVTADALDPG